jgi:preprotein translocase subunit YajC
VGQLVIIAAMFALLWMLLIRPQRAKQQKQRALLESVAVGDEILTVGGLYGIVQEIDDEDDLVVEIAEGIHARIARRAVASTVKPEDDDELDEDDESEDVVDAELVDEGTVTESEDSVSTGASVTAGGSERS